MDQIYFITAIKFHWLREKPKDPTIKFVSNGQDQNKAQTRNQSQLKKNVGIFYSQEGDKTMILLYKPNTHQSLNITRT